MPAGKRAAVVMSLIQSAKMNGHDPYDYIKDFLTRLPTQKANQIEDLIPHLAAGTHHRFVRPSDNMCSPDEYDSIASSNVMAKDQVRDRRSEC
jgi:hypothetical protein